MTQKGFDVKKGSPASEKKCYAKSRLQSERELVLYDDWDYETFLKRRAKLVDWMKSRWALED